MKRLLVPGYRQLRNGQPAKAAFVNLSCSVLLLAAGVTPWLHTPAGLFSWFGVLLALCVWAAVDARRHREPAPAPPVSWWMWTPIALLAVALLFNPTRVAVYHIPTGSCTPVLMPGDRVLADRWPGDAERGAMILFGRPNGKTFVKRLIALGGDEVTGGADGLHVNGVRVSDVAVEPFRLVVPDGRGFVLGNNVKNSRDSRKFGPIRIDTIIGRPLFVLWGGTWGRTLTTIH